MLISVVAGFALSVMALGAVAPSITEMIYAKKVEINIGRAEALMQQIIRYRAITGNYPANMAELQSANYWRAVDNDNGFGGTYTFTIDAAKGLIAISTTIADAVKRVQYLNNYRHIFKPVDMGSGVVTTTFVMPSSGAVSTAVPASGSIPVSSTAPSAASNTWWYDTSGSTAVLKVSDGTTWKAASSGSTVAPATSNIVEGVASLPATGTSGDVRYVFDSATNSLSSYIWYNDKWVMFGGGGSSNNTGTTGITNAGGTGSSGGTSLPSIGGSGGASTSTGGFKVSSTFISANQDCTYTDGLLGMDSLGAVYACSDPAINGGLLPSMDCTNIGRLTYDVTGDYYECVP